MGPGCRFVSAADAPVALGRNVDRDLSSLGGAAGGRTRRRLAQLVTFHACGGQPFEAYPRASSMRSASPLLPVLRTMDARSTSTVRTDRFSSAAASLFV